MLYDDSQPCFGIANYLLDRGMTVSIRFTTADQSEQYSDSLPAHWRERCVPIIGEAETLEQAELQVASAAAAMDGLDVYIHGSEWADESELLDNDLVPFAQHLNQRLHELFMFSRASASVMARKRQGQIIVPMLSDALHYAGFPSSPVYNQGALSFVKSLAKELAPFRVAVNAFTFGYCQLQSTAASSRPSRGRFDIYALKPPIPDVEEMTKGLGMLLDYGSGMSGQNINWGYGLPSV
ncbi:SDR family NAD(P)-dependent oxidoreductase [Paenibacillaceae bacterium]|nr:SDR family NAD(P)-dependent oxidoreductase [Paenibacillaceae bacterium]